jgi:CRISPR/Cas system-associated exonuclease Cas4 (RecB family)
VNAQNVIRHARKIKDERRGWNWKRGEQA